jgi:hypothetical protein
MRLARDADHLLRADGEVSVSKVEAELAGVSSP